MVARLEDYREYQRGWGEAVYQSSTDGCDEMAIRATHRQHIGCRQCGFH